MTNQLSPEGELFKFTMSRPQAAKEFLQAYLPEYIRNRVDLNTLQLREDSFVDEQLKGHLTGVLYSVNFGNTIGYIYLLHLSIPDKLLPFRILKYTIKIMEDHIERNKSQTLPLVYPLVIYTGDKAYNNSAN